MQDESRNATNNEPRRESTNSSFTAGAMDPFVHANGTTSIPTTTNKDTTTIGNDMMDVARRIRDRARVLEDEQKKAEATRDVLRELYKKRDKEKAINDRYRKRLLQITNERNAVELEVFGCHESIGDCEKQTRAMEQETLESEETIRKLLQRRTEQTKSFYGPNLAKMETFVEVLQNIVESKEKAEEAKRKRVEDLRVQIKDSKKREGSILRETKDAEKVIDREQRIGSSGANVDADEKSTKSETSNKSGNNGNTDIGRDDQEITNLSRKVRDAIEEVSKVSSRIVFDIRLF